MKNERYHLRDRSYGAWHRMASIGRYLCQDQAASLTMVDLDSVLFTEYDHLSKWPLALVEVGRDIGQEKPASVMQHLARLADVPAYIALYTPASTANPANPNWADIDHFRVRRMWPCPEVGWRLMTPAQWARALIQIRGWQMRRFERRDAANDTHFDLQ